MPFVDICQKFHDGFAVDQKPIFFQKNDVFSKKFREKTIFLEMSAPALKAHIVRHHLEKTRTFYLSREKINKHFCVMATHKIPNHKKKNSTAS